MGKVYVFFFILTGFLGFLTPTALAEPLDKMIVVKALRDFCKEEVKCLSRIDGFFEWFDSRKPEERLYIANGFVCPRREKAVKLYNQLNAGRPLSWNDLMNHGCVSNKRGPMYYIQPIKLEDNGVILEVVFTRPLGKRLLRGYTIKSFLRPVPKLLK